MHALYHGVTGPVENGASTWFAQKQYKVLATTYHILLHLDIKAGEQVLYYKNINTIMSMNILAEKVDGRDGSAQK